MKTLDDGLFVEEQQTAPITVTGGDVDTRKINTLALDSDGRRLLDKLKKVG